MCTEFLSVGMCCFCKERCNPLSQSCGRCARNLFYLKFDKFELIDQIKFYIGMDAKIAIVFNNKSFYQTLDENDIIINEKTKEIYDTARPFSNAHLFVVSNNNLNYNDLEQSGFKYFEKKVKTIEDLKENISKCEKVFFV